jgi:hypothetical protein
MDLSRKLLLTQRLEVRLLLLLENAFAAILNLTGQVPQVPAQNKHERKSPLTRVVVLQLKAAHTADVAVPTNVRRVVVLTVSKPAGVASARPVAGSLPLQ